ncbi:3-oxoacyl-reductase [Thalassiosira pseudonana CCMP1335]
MASWLKLANQTVVISGAASGIGRACAHAFASEGCNLLLVDVQSDLLNNVASACRASSSSNILVKTSLCNVTDKSQVNEAVEDADHLATQSNAIPRAASILVNCAGITRDGKIDNISDADWNDVLDINLKGTFHMCQSFCRTKRLASLLSDGNENEATGTATGGSIINIGSIVAQYGNVGQVNYASSKGGVVGLTRSLAKEMALFSHKFVQNKGIGAGFIHTPMAHAVPEKILSEMKRKIALRRLGRPGDVANLTLYLASAERSGYITGEVMECSGMLRL